MDRIPQNCDQFDLMKGNCDVCEENEILTDKLCCPEFYKWDNEEQDCVKNEVLNCWQEEYKENEWQCIECDADNDYLVSNGGCCKE